MSETPQESREVATATAESSQEEQDRNILRMKRLLAASHDARVRFHEKTRHPEGNTAIPVLNETNIAPIFQSERLAKNVANAVKIIESFFKRQAMEDAFMSHQKRRQWRKRFLASGLHDLYAYYETNQLRKGNLFPVRLAISSIERTLERSHNEKAKALQLELQKAGYMGELRTLLEGNAEAGVKPYNSLPSNQEKLKVVQRIEDIAVQYLRALASIIQNPVEHNPVGLTADTFEDLDKPGGPVDRQPSPEPPNAPVDATVKLEELAELPK